MEYGLYIDTPSYNIHGIIIGRDIYEFFKFNLLDRFTCTPTNISYSWNNTYLDFSSVSVFYMVSELVARVPTIGFKISRRLVFGS